MAWFVGTLTILWYAIDGHARGRMCIGIGTGTLTR